MSKTVAGILETVVGVALVLGTTGVGQVIGISLIAAGAATLLMPTPKTNSPDNSVKTANPPRVQALGRRRLFGAYIFFDTEPNSGCGFDVLAFHDCPVSPIDGVEAIFLGDKRVSSGVQGTINAFSDGTYSQGAVGTFYQLGARIGTAFALMTSFFPSIWDSTHRGDGVVTGMVKWNPVKAADYNTVYPNGQPQMSLVARWTKVYDWRDPSQSLTDPTTWKWSENAVLGYVWYKLINEGERPTVPSVVAGAANADWDAQLSAILTRKWAGLFAPTLDLWTAAADDADSPVPITQFRSLIVNTLTHGAGFMELALVTGLAPGMTITLTASQSLAYTETLTVTSVVGNFVHFTPGLAYDHADGSLATWESTGDNPLTEARYRTCATWNMTTAHKDNLSTIRNCFDGWVAPREDGALVCYSGRYYVPTVIIGPDAIVSYSLDNGIDDDRAINQIVLTSVSPEHNYATPECEPWEDTDDIATRGRVASTTLENHVPSYTQGRRLAKRYMARIMAEYRGTITTNQLGRVADGQRFVHLTITEGGVTWFDGPVEITKLTHTQTGITFEFVSADPDVDDWNPATEEGLPAPVGSTAAIQPLATPTISSATAYLADNSASGTPGARIDIVAAGADRDDVTWYARTRTTGTAVWNEATYTDIDASAAVQLQTAFVATDTTVDVEVAYGLGDGRISDYSATSVVDTSTDMLAPGPVTGFTATGATGSTALVWTNPPSSNYSQTRLYRGTTGTFTSATLIATVPGSRGASGSYTDTVTAGSYFYWAVAVSVNGVAASPTGPKTATVT